MPGNQRRRVFQGLSGDWRRALTDSRGGKLLGSPRCPGLSLVVKHSVAACVAYRRVVTGEELSAEMTSTDNYQSLEANSKPSSR